jgi:hypothetical protein
MIGVRGDVLKSRLTVPSRMIVRSLFEALRFPAMPVWTVWTSPELVESHSLLVLSGSECSFERCRTDVG